MKALTVKVPWAQLLVNGQKRIELRTWRTSYVGDLAIHAGLEADPHGPLHLFPRPELLTRGAVIGKVRLVACRPMTPDDADAARHAFRPEFFAWVVVDPVVFPAPVPMKGRLGLWEAELPY